MRTEQVDWKQLTFGVEIEFVGGRPEDVELLPGWVMSLDELQTDDAGEESGSELKPPPLRWADREQVRAMLARLLATGAEANWSCGLHVHVGLEPWAPEGIPRLIDAALRYQESVQALLQTAEDRLVYCPPVDPEMRDRYRSDPSEASLLRSGRPQSHRCGLNLAAWHGNGTIEIRYANGSLRYEEVMATVAFALRFVAAIGEGRELPADPRLLALAIGAPTSGYPPPLPAPRWHHERVWLEDALIPTLLPHARRLIPGSEILDVRPRPDGLLVRIEDVTDGRHYGYLFRLTAAGWVVERPLSGAAPEVGRFDP
ncbi:amidoligase family protein [Cohnella sp. REN36]|uniref:amidoligase family protein n=1 Tax=Cohnella sp. REN36 TaxID=2887347 RepID=UPI001D147D91|nr:amidoligase family protein [Cohnella sp. REN36]MCC3376091.1 amidoligase family protein [Cohnella sp. REN36]